MAAMICLSASLTCLGLEGGVGLGGIGGAAARPEGGQAAPAARSLRPAPRSARSRRRRPRKPPQPPCPPPGSHSHAGVLRHVLGEAAVEVDGARQALALLDDAGADAHPVVVLTKCGGLREEGLKWVRVGGQGG
jgi:hypothetical protein